MSYTVRVNGVDYTGVSAVELNTPDGEPVLFQAGGEKVLNMDAALLNAGGVYPADADDYTTAVIPAEATFVSLEAFNNLPNLDTLIVNGDCEFEVFEEYDNTTKASVSVNAITKNRIPIRKLVVQNRTTDIPNQFMSGVGPLVEVEISGSLGSNTFYNCYYLKKAILENCNYIGNAAFYCCTNLREITIPAEVTSIGAGAFLGCQNLKTITILGMGTDVESASIPPDTTIRAYAGSAAETYANNNTYHFEVIE